MKLLRLSVHIQEATKVNDIKLRTYSELKKLKTYKDRFNYLKIHNAGVGISTFGFDRYLNQDFYKSKEWKRVRDEVIVRDKCCDLGIEGREICGKVYVHHMNPLTVEDVKFSTDFLLNPEYLICVSHETHNAIHYGDDAILDKYECKEREKNDTCPWRKK